MNTLLSDKVEKGCLPFDIPAKDWWFVASRMALTEIGTARGAFALTDLVELNLLGCYYDRDCDKEKVREKVSGYIAEIKQKEHQNPRHKKALMHQLERYQYSVNNEDWEDEVGNAIKGLEYGWSKEPLKRGLSPNIR